MEVYKSENYSTFLKTIFFWDTLYVFRYFITIRKYSTSTSSSLLTRSNTQTLLDNLNQYSGKSALFTPCLFSFHVFTVPFLFEDQTVIFHVKYFYIISVKLK